jgi:hexosaminidase
MLSCASAATDVAIIPKPQRMETGHGSFRLDPQVGVVAGGDARMREIAAFLRAAVRRQTGVALARGKAAREIVLELDPAVHGDEAYRLAVTAQGVTISAATDKGLFWGVQTLRQLLPLRKAAQVDIPALHIEDAPAFAWRGVMLDVSRHFYPVDFIEKQLDLLSYYKINTFHWHLTDDQGWRIQIRRYPKLTGVGAWRTEADGTRYGGYYTQAQIREVVDYARARNITVIPEIEMPGHSSAALAAYPWLSCSGKAPPVPASWGVFKDIDCVGKPATFDFLEHVLDEVIPLFPTPYLHVGGDEVPKDQWHDCAACQALMRRQGLKDEEGLQGWFIQRIQRYLTGKGKTLMGWDEILEGGADHRAVVEAWRGPDEARKALANGNRIVVAGPFYLDTPQDKLGTRDVYLVDVAGYAASAAQRAQVLGGEAPLWSEQANPMDAESKLYPRVLALAENLWSGGGRDAAAWADFHRRLQAHYPRLDAWQVAYGPEDKPVAGYSVTADAQGTGWHLHARRGFDDVRSHYTLDGSAPTAQSPAFGDAVAIPRAGTLRVAPFRHGRPYDEAVRFTLEDNLARGRPLSFAQPVSPDYAPGAVLVDGVAGSDDFHDGCWAAWHDSDAGATIDLGRAEAIHSIEADFLQDVGSRILPPRRVAFSVSSDGRQWTLLHAVEPQVDLDEVHQRRWAIRYQAAKPLVARYLRVDAQRRTDVPPEVPGGDEDTWLFVDEIRIR